MPRIVVPDSFLKRIGTIKPKEKTTEQKRAKQADSTSGILKIIENLEKQLNKTPLTDVGRRKNFEGRLKQLRKELHRKKFAQQLE
ncbi:MAG: hypothetical protein J4224_04995 [Candidatus Diapherotrites archaeon]|uniref:Uncharacterized protein n=1 Tax=Candidatus Iainarchaeum sp. TaxID=3101447 RepID=A0A7J4ISQ5_9ARCH|nr:MAG: hypothetical protein QT03_C0001G0165 [archaeon GW2011_AR10]MBS3059749.1 hypothetical protein [Candidatus Diapherotrites archaeon]HIH08492.1 hypothetical protein [Candidatus Diapherotrites archaeon]